jgi:riboflavin biosynthesis pyrimidine reductase
MNQEPKVIIHTLISLDGFVAGPGDDMSWIFNQSEPALDLSRHIASIGAVIMGRRTQEVDIRQRPKPEQNFVYGGFNGPIFVLSKERHEAERDPKVQYVSGDVTQALKEAMQAAAGGNVLLLGATVWREFLEAGLVDEILVHVAPVLLGDGIRLYDVPGTRLIELELTESVQIGKLAQLKFKVKKAAPAEA